MLTAYITHPVFLRHTAGDWHPDSPQRLQAIEDRLHAAHLFDFLAHCEAERATREQLLRVHDAALIDALEAASPQAGFHALDGDTRMNPHTLEAALYAAGGAAMAVDRIMRGEVANAFVACRPPGHHAGRRQAAGFCFFNNVAVAAAHALDAHGLERVAIVDFDVHHGNGTEDIFRNDPRVMMAGIFQHPFYPYCGTENPPAHMCNVPLPAGTRGDAFRQVFGDIVVPALRSHSPQMIFISAGFDAHYEDDMGSLGLLEADYIWATQQIKGVAESCGHKRIVSILEGGYSLSSLARSVVAHIKTLADL